MTSPMPQIGPRIDVGDDYIAIYDLIAQERELAHALRDLSSEERIAAVLKIISLGSETYRIITTTAAAESFKAVATEIVKDVSAQKTELVAGIEEIARKLGADTGDLSVKAALDTWRSDFKTLLDRSFDATNTESILSKFDSMIEAKRKSEQSELASRLSFDIADSAVNILQARVRQDVESVFAPMVQALDAVKQKLGIDEVLKDEKKKQASRGTTFETQIFEMLEEFSRANGDEADDPGLRKESGLDGNDEGDVTIEVNSEATSGYSKTIVVECKLRKVRLSDRALLKELDKGLSNRGGHVGFIVTQVSDGKALDPFDFFHTFSGSRAILEVDPENPDPNALRFAYLWARWMCLREQGTELDSNVVSESLDSIKRAIGAVRNIKSNNSSALKKLESNESALETLEKNVLDEIASLEDVIASVNDDSNLS